MTPERIPQAMNPPNVVLRTKPPGSDHRLADAWTVVTRIRDQDGQLLVGQEAFTDVYHRHTAYLAVDERTDRIVGLAVVKGMGHISVFGVDPSEQGQGIGTYLLEEIVAKKPVVSLLVRENNHRAREFYRRNGLVEVEQKSRSYPDGERAVFMKHHQNSVLLDRPVIALR